MNQLELIKDEHDQVERMASLDPVFQKKLREYQDQCLSEVRGHIRAAFAEGNKGINILLVAPTGSGKTLIASYIIYETVRKYKRANFVVDRINLIDQTAEAFEEFGVKFGVHQADHWKYRPYERAQLCTAQTMVRRKWPDSDIDIIDEAHTLYDVVKKRIGGRERITLGLTATPFTKGLGLYFDALVNVTTTNKLIKDGFLSPFRVFAASEPDMEGCKVVAGEWSEKDASKRALKIVGDCVSEYKKHCDGMKFICRGVDVEHVQELHKQFMEAGVMCATYTYMDRDEERKEIVKEFKKPDSFYRGLITVSAATKGFDVPDIECVIDARPLRKALHEVIQFIGRGFRISPATGKSECIILDHSGNMMRFWDQIMEFFETGAVELDDGTKKPKEPKPQNENETHRKCTRCGHIHAPMPFCPQCGFEYPKRENAVKHEAGTLAEVIKAGDQKKLTADLWPQLVQYARDAKNSSADPKAAERMAMAMYKEMTGDWPRATFHSTAPKELTQEVKNKITAMRIRFAKGKKAGARPSGKPAKVNAKKLWEAYDKGGA